MISTFANTIVGTSFWMAPEVMKSEPYTLSADVYGYSMILYEMISNQLPFQGLNPMQLVMKIAVKNERPSLPDNIDNRLKQIIEKVKILFISNSSLLLLSSVTFE